MRRQVAYHEAGHAIVAYLLGYTGIWVDMKFSKLKAVTGWARNTLTPTMLADGSLLLGGGVGGDPECRSAFVRALQDELIVAVAGLVADVQIAGYRTGYVEPEVLGRAVHLVRACSALPICGRSGGGGKKCKVGLSVDQFDHTRILTEGLPICSRRSCGAPRGIDLDDIVGYAEAEAFALLEANWPAVKRLVRKLCRYDQFLLPDLRRGQQAYRG
jgi:hypothetical protein